MALWTSTPLAGTENTAKEDPVRAHGPTIREYEDFIQQLNGAMEALGDEVPTPAQWAALRGKIQTQVAAVVAKRLMDTLTESQDMIRAREAREAARAREELTRMYTQQVQQPEAYRGVVAPPTTITTTTDLQSVISKKGLLRFL